MKIKKKSEIYNPVLKRKELTFFIDHVSSGTPQLHNVKKNIAMDYSINEENVYVLKLNTLTGTNRTIGIAEIYDNIEEGKALISEHIKMRNLPSRRAKKG